MEEAPGHWEPRGNVEQAGGDMSLPGEESGPALRCQVQRPEPRLVCPGHREPLWRAGGVGPGARGQARRHRGDSQVPGERAGGRSVPEQPREGGRGAEAVAGGQGARSRATTAVEMRGGRRRGVDCGRAVPKAGDVLAEREAAQQGPLREHRGGLKASSALAWPGWAGMCRGQTGQGERGGDGACPQVDDGVRGSGPRCKPGAGRGP